MLKKTITYTDYDGEERTEVFWFNISRTELVDLEMDHKGGYKAAIERMQERSDARGLKNEFKKIIRMSYGVKSEDGKRFVKSPALTDEFIQSPAYDELFFELLNGGADAMAAFVNGVITIPEKDRKKLLAATKDANN